MDPDILECFAYANVGRPVAKTSKLTAHPNLAGKWLYVDGKTAVAMAH